MKKLKRLEELTIDVQRQVIGGESLTGTCYCSCECNCNCDCSCYCEDRSNHSSTSDYRSKNTKWNHKNSTTDKKASGRKKEIYYLKN